MYWKFKELIRVNKMSDIEILIQLKNQLVNFLDELAETYPDEPDFVIFRHFVSDKIPIVDIMEYIVTHLCPLQDMVKNRNEEFFLNRNILFENLHQDSTNKINYFKRLWTSEVLDKENKETIWKWFNAFIYLGNKYTEAMKRKQ